jgi:hypothetical protein
MEELLNQEQEVVDTQPEVEEVEVQEEETQQERNFRALKDKIKRLERENEDFRNSFTQQAQPEEDDYGIESDALAEGKHIKKVGKKVKALEDQLKHYQNQANMAHIENQLRKRFSDFDEVVTTENIEILRDSDPDIARSLSGSSDLYGSAVLAYKMIKDMNKNAEDNYEKQRVTKNMAKPRPIVSSNAQQGDSPLAQANTFANGLTKELSAKLWKEMNDLRKTI